MRGSSGRCAERCGIGRLSERTDEMAGLKAICKFRRIKQDGTLGTLAQIIVIVTPGQTVENIIAIARENYGGRLESIEIRGDFGAE